MSLVDAAAFWLQHFGCSILAAACNSNVDTSLKPTFHIILLANVFQNLEETQQRQCEGHNTPQEES